MRITFICGSLAPGQDGVGDYTRRLADELTKSGHECQLVSLNDIEDARSKVNEGIEIIRNRNAIRDGASEAEIQAAIAEWKPDWISLQFVCFAFHPKGFIHRLIPCIEGISKIAPIHIMFHELWLGEQPDLPFRHRILGIFQKRQILEGLKRWRPACIHTSNLLYQSVLETERVYAERLPIFGNIPIVRTGPQEPDNETGIRRLVFPFSQRHDWNVEETMARLFTLTEQTDLHLELVQVGKLRNDAKHWNYVADFAKAKGWSCRILGPQSEETLSRILQSADIGICAAHVALADKSGAAVAMLEHGLPVICTITKAVSKRFANLDVNQANLYSFFDSDEQLLNLIVEPKSQPPQSRLPAIAEKWLKDISINS